MYILKKNKNLQISVKGDYGGGGGGYNTLTKENFLNPKNFKHIQTTHFFHIVDPSPWPIVAALGSLMLTFGMVMHMHRYKGGTSLLLTGLSVILFVMFTWWRDVIREALYEDKHSERVQNGIRLGIALFILSEVMLFFSFFWAFFHSSTSPAFNLGNSWPPGGVDGLYHLGMPLSNSLILLSSAACVTWAHESFSLRDKKGSLYGLFSGISFAIIFTGFQMYEYKTAVFCISDGIFGSCFYMTTGFHGFHVIVGTIALVVSMFRVGFNHFTDTQHIGLESSIWYWHFVDYVWLLLYLSIYWWGCDPSKN